MGFAFVIRDCPSMFDQLRAAREQRNARPKILTKDQQDLADWMKLIQSNKKRISDKLGPKK